MGWAAVVCFSSFSSWPAGCVSFRLLSGRAGLVWGCLNFALLVGMFPSLAWPCLVALWGSSLSIPLCPSSVYCMLIGRWVVANAFNPYTLIPCNICILCDPLVIISPFFLILSHRKVFICLYCLTFPQGIESCSTQS